MKMFKRAAKFFGYLLLSFFLLVALVLGYGAMQGNFHEVYPQELYRSSQLYPWQLEKRIKENKIRSVLNLRGSAPGEAWYEEELATTTASGAVHADFEMSARDVLERAEMEQLIAIMETLPKPLLIHCWGGADRSGLAAALYAYQVKRAPTEEAKQQLSAKYGHLPYLFWSDTDAMDVSFWNYVSNAETATRPQ